MELNYIDIADEKYTTYVWIIILFILLNLISYITKMPLFHEEPRRVIVAQEMLLTGDYIVPKVYQKPYWKKPPFQNWMIALFSLPLGKVTDYSARLVSIVFFLITGIFIYWLLQKQNKSVAFTAFLIITTNYLMMCEFGNKAEPDITFTALLFISYYFYMKFPRQWKYYIISSIFMGASILTKGISPLFFYPGLIIYYLFFKKENKTQSLKFLIFHFFLSLLLPLLWLALYYTKGDINILINVFENEIGLRTQSSPSKFLWHLFYYPIKIWIVLLPWSLIVFLTFKKNNHPNEIYQTSFLIFLISIILFTLTPGARDRYLMPAFPFFAIMAAYHINSKCIVPQSISRLVLGFYLISFLAGTVFFLYKGFYLQSIIFTLTGCIIIAILRKKFKILAFALLITTTFLIAFEHGLYFYRSQIKYDYKTPAKLFSEKTNKDLPIIVDDRISPIQFVAYWEGFIKKPIYSSKVLTPQEYYLLTMPALSPDNGKVVYRLPYHKEKIDTLIIKYIQ